MDVRLLTGVVEYRGAGGVAKLPGTSARAILAMLALRPGELLLSDEIVEGLWGRRFPHDPTAAVQVTISRLRRALGEDRGRLRTVPLGYLLDVNQQEVDVGRAESALSRGRQLIQRGDTSSAEVAFSAGLGEWHHDAPLVEFADLPFGPIASSRLLTLRCDLVESCNQAALDLGRPEDVVARTAGVIKLDPWREPLVGQLMRALQATGRPAEALGAYASFAASLKEDLNVDPSVQLQSLRSEITTAGVGDPSQVDLRELTAPAWFEAALQELDREEDDPLLRARLQLALGQAEQHAGLPGWEQSLRRAAATARAAGDTNLVARCLLAAAPGWSTSTGASDPVRLRQMSELLEGGNLNEDVAARLLAAYANELTFASSLEQRIAISDKAVALARRSGNPTTLLAVLNQRFNAIWAPETHDVRLCEVAQACELAEESGHLAAQAICEGFAMAAAAEAADTSSIDEHLAKFTVLANQLRLPLFEWGAVVHASWRSALSGDLDTSEDLAERALHIGRRAARPEADIVYTNQMAALLWRRGRLGELLGAMAPLADYLPIFEALSSNGHVQAGDQGRARRTMRDAWASGAISSLRHDQLYISILAQWADVATATHEQEPAEYLYATLQPYESRLAFTGTSVFHPVARYLANLAEILGHTDASETYSDLAAGIDEQFRSPARNLAPGSDLTP